MFEVSEEFRICSRCRRRGHYCRDCKMKNEQDSYESMKTKTSNCSFPSTHNSSRKNSFSHKQQITSHYSRKYKYHENYRSSQNALRDVPKYKLKKHDPKNSFKLHSTTGFRQEYKNIPGNSRNLRNLYRNNTNEKCTENAEIYHKKCKIFSYPAYENNIKHDYLQVYCSCEHFSKQHDIFHDNEKMSRHTDSHSRYVQDKKQIENGNRTHPQDKYTKRSKDIESTVKNPPSTNQDNDNSGDTEYVSVKESVNNAYQKSPLGLQSICEADRSRFESEENDPMKRENGKKPNFKKDQEYQNFETSSNDPISLSEISTARENFKNESSIREMKMQPKYM